MEEILIWIVVLIHQAFIETLKLRKSKNKQKGLDTTFCLPFAYTVEGFLQAMKFPSGREREGGIR